MRRRIAVCDDEKIMLRQLSQYLTQIQDETGEQYDLSYFASSEELLEHMPKDVQVILLDISMGRMTGMECARALRAKGCEAAIIFITNLVQYALRGYEVDAVSFLLKPVSYYDFSLKFKKALDIYLMNEERSFTVNAPGGLCRISTDKLMYVEIIKHRLHYHLIDGVIEMTGVLSNVERELGSYGFLRCNTCYLVNPKFIVRVKGSEVQVGDRTLQISRPRRAAFMEGLTNWYAGAGGGSRG